MRVNERWREREELANAAAALLFACCSEVRIDFLPASTSCLVVGLQPIPVSSRPPYYYSVFLCLLVCLSLPLYVSVYGASGVFFDPYYLTYIECRRALGGRLTSEECGTQQGGVPCSAE